MSNSKRISRRGKFTFIGNFKKVANETNGFRAVKNDKGYEGQTMQFGIDANGDRGFVEIHGGRYKTDDKLRFFEDSPFDGKGGMVEVAFSQRNDIGMLMLAADFSKVVVDLTEDKETKDRIHELKGKLYNLRKKGFEATEEDQAKYSKYKRELIEMPSRHEFLGNSSDAVSFIFENLAKLNEKVVRVSGDIEYSEYKGKIQTRYQLNSIELVIDEEVEHKLEVKLFPIFDKNSVDKSQVKETGKVIIKGWAESYYKQLKGMGFYPMEFVIDTKGFDLSKEEDVNNLVVLLSLFKVEDEGVYQLGWQGRIRSVSDSSEVQLTEVQKSMIAIGVLKESDVVPFGVFEDETVLEKPMIVGDFKDGKISVGLSREEFDKAIVIPNKVVVVNEKETKEEVKEETKEEVKEVTQEASDILNSIFGD